MHKGRSSRHGMLWGTCLMNAFIRATCTWEGGGREADGKWRRQERDRQRLKTLFSYRLNKGKQANYATELSFEYTLYKWGGFMMKTVLSADCIW